MPSDSSTQNFQAFRFPSLSATEALTVLSEFEEEYVQTLLDSNLHISIESSGNRFYLPAYHSKSKLTETQVKELHSSFKLKIQSVTNQAKLTRGIDTPGSFNFIAMLPIPEAFFTLALNQRTDKFTKIDNSDILVYVDGKPEDIGESISKIIRYGRDVEVVAVGNDQTSLTSTIVHYNDFTEDYGTVSGWIASQNVPEGLKTLIPCDAGDYKLWLPSDEQLPKGENLALLGQILENYLPIIHSKKDISEVIYIQREEKNITIVYGNIDDHKIPSEDIIENAEPAEPYNLRILTSFDAEKTKATLTQAIEDYKDQVGYKVALRSIPKHVSAGINTEPIIEKIEELEELVAQINALRAPQLRLMRFSDAQLPALIDGLRSLTPEVLNSGEILYTSGHSTGRDEPVHFILYNPTTTNMKLNDIIWRNKTEPHAITFWLEPYVAEALTQRPAKTSVFVPTGHFLVPSLAHFGSNVDGALRIVLGKLFADLGDHLNDEDAEPIFIFAPTEDKGFNLEVEVTDRRWFQPVHQKLNWLNDYLMVRGSQVVAEEDLKEVASELYQGRFTNQIKQEINNTKISAQEEWESVTGKVHAEGLEIFQLLIKDIETSTQYVTDAFKFLTVMGKKLDDLEEIINQAKRAISQKNLIVETLSTKDKELIVARKAFLERLTTEYEIGEALLAESEEKIKKLRARLKRVIEWSE